MPIIEQNNVTLSSSTTTTVTFTDSSIKSNSNIELECSEDIQYDSKSISNGSCSFTFPIQSNSITVNFRLTINDPNYYRIAKSPNNLGNATTARVQAGKTFTSANGIGLTGTATLSPFYKQMGSYVTCTFTGTAGSAPSATNYTCDIVYCGPRTYGDPTSGYKMCLLANNKVGTANYSTAYYYTWTATFAAGQLSDEIVTITNVKMPTYDEIINYCCDRLTRSSRFYAPVNNMGYYLVLSAAPNNSSGAMVVANDGGNINAYGAGGISSIGLNDSSGVVPYITINI